MAIKEQDKVFYEEAENGDKVINLPITRANNVEGLGRSANTAYVVGDVVYVDNNKKVALKCTTSGTTSNTELGISGVSVGQNVTDGSVVWEIVSRDTLATIDQQRPIKTFTSLEQLGLADTCTPEDIYNAMPIGSMLCFMYMGYGENAQHPNIGYSGNAPLVVTKTGNMASFWIYADGRLPSYAIYADWASTKFSGWKRVADSSALSMPNTQYFCVTLPLVENSATQITSLVYTAPCDGWLRIEAFKGSALNNFRIIAIPETYWNGVAMALNSPYNSAVNNDNMIFSIPMAKGNSLKIEYINLRKLEGVFIPAQSEV